MLSAVRAQQPGALDELLDRHRAALRWVVETRLDPKVRQRVDASDVVQDVLIEAHRRLNEYLATPTLPFHLWLRQLAKQRVIDTYRRHRLAARRDISREISADAALPDRSSLNWAGQIADPQLTPAAANLQAELISRFSAAIEQLEESDREILLMRHFEHLSNHETAVALGLSDPAAGMRYLRALRRLRQVLGPHASGDENSFLGPPG
jgi:RNA polymerase sigma-70 factor (ECF subfamily)